MVKFVVRLLLGVLVVALVGHGDFNSFLTFFEQLYLSLARTIDPSYNLTVVAQKFLVWMAALVAIVSVLKL